MNKNLVRRIEALERRLGTSGPKWPLVIWIRTVGGDGEDEASYRFGGPCFDGERDNMLERDPGETLDAFEERIKAAFPPKRKGDVSIYRLTSNR